ncbi:hypothetical protein [Halobacillus sp. KGW1]|uniref:hypothetical protein n=1 Tax=Halobacillus sp. KGW1 TaxID=1793726 RepID=UPI000783B6B4|nr:hypothetical protein [Halobacillus sp. KGW1]
MNIDQFLISDLRHVAREMNCLKDLHQQLRMQTAEMDMPGVMNTCLDIQRSVSALEEMKMKKERQGELLAISKKLYWEGVLCSVVRRYENEAIRSS